MLTPLVEPLLLKHLVIFAKYLVFELVLVLVGFEQDLQFLLVEI